MERYSVKTEQAKCLLSEVKKKKVVRLMTAPTLLYGAESWSLRKANVSKIIAAEMRLLRMVKGCSRSDMLHNQYIRTSLRCAQVF